MNGATRAVLVSSCLIVVTLSLSACAQDAPETNAPPERALETAVQLQEAFASVAERAFPSVVCITSYVRDEAPATKPASTDSSTNQWRGSAQRGSYSGFRKLHSGTGFILEEQAHVVTLRRFVTRPSGEPAEIVDVETQEGQHLMSRVVGVEPTLDVAVLQFVALSDRFPPRLISALIGDSDSLRVGHWTFALGDPAGSVKVFTPGVVSALPERSCYQEQLTVTYMQAALKVHPEAYGGPLVNIHGEVVGMLMPPPADQSDAGLEFALPINVLMPIYDGISTNQSFRSPWLGFSVLEIADLRQSRSEAEYEALARPRFGVYIDDVFDPSPAATAGIRVGDFLLSFNGKRLFSVYQFQEQLHLNGVGRTAKLELFRDGQTRILDVPVEERPDTAVPR